MFGNYLQIGTKDALIGVIAFVVLIMLLLFHWSAVEFLITELLVCAAFFAGTMKRDKRLDK